MFTFSGMLRSCFRLCTATLYRPVAASYPWTSPKERLTSCTGKLHTCTVEFFGMGPSSVKAASGPPPASTGSSSICQGDWYLPGIMSCCFCCWARAWAIHTAWAASSALMGGFAGPALSAAATLCASRILSLITSSGDLGAMAWAAAILCATLTPARSEAAFCWAGAGGRVDGTSMACAASACARSRMLGSGVCCGSMACFRALNGFSVVGRGVGSKLCWAPSLPDIVGKGTPSLTAGPDTTFTRCAWGLPSSKTRSNSTVSPAMRPMRPISCELYTKTSRGNSLRSTNPKPFFVL
mmetsp:Transcript_110459/g.313357  ORF Transcript_110459/g.313357 Transcript_110459/m.313357 type:complete len:296 (-) Transcript_110459:153-1040(-)